MCRRLWEGGRGDEEGWGLLHIKKKKKKDILCTMCAAGEAGVLGGIKMHGCIAHFLCMSNTPQCKNVLFVDILFS